MGCDMIRMPLQDIVARLKEQAGLSEEEIMRKVDEKCASLSGLISKEGAAHIIANELGVKLFEAGSGKIKDLLPGMRNAEVLGRVTQIYEVREFQRADGSAGKVGSFMLGDDTGFVRVVCWGKQADLLNELAVGEPVKITGAMVRESQRGYKELHLNEYSRVDLEPEGDIPEVMSRDSAKRKQLSDLVESEEQVEIMGTVVQVFDPKFFEVCPKCSSRLKDVEGQWACNEHGVQEPDYSYLVNVFVDDGSDNIRVVLFRNQAEKLLGKSKEGMLSFHKSPDSFEKVKVDLLGEQFRFIGRAKKNTFFDRLEFVANRVYKADPEEELSRLESQQV
ncbi:hypothetical protein D6825_01400 [Candidatus Woesearchaeota archaeon]|nr:MAG: hypothetical protein D6825_01400 [Candidatus Woesearchaeota archaeon]